jgi:hypothetical protein
VHQPGQLGCVVWFDEQMKMMTIQQMPTKRNGCFCFALSKTTSNTPRLMRLLINNCRLLHRSVM